MAIAGPTERKLAGRGAHGGNGGGSQTIRAQGHSYSAELMAKACELVFKANASFRGAAQALEILWPGAGKAAPSFWSIRNWAMRLGLHELQRPKPAGEDWALILDHTIQLGPHRALLVLGTRLNQ